MAGKGCSRGTVRVLRWTAMAEDDFRVVDDEPGDEDGGGEDEAAPGREAEFDDARIRRLSGERRAIFRQRSYCIVLTGFCVVAMFELIWSAAREVRHVGWDP